MYKLVNLLTYIKWCRNFINGHINVHDEERSGTQTEGIVSEEDQKFRSERPLTIIDLAELFFSSWRHYCLSIRSKRSIPDIVCKAEMLTVQHKQKISLYLMYWRSLRFGLS